MTDNNTQNTTQQANTQPEGNGTAGKTFTQEEVNSIVRERLARERAKGTTTPGSTQETDTEAEKAQLETDRKQLQTDRNMFECERYCKENGIDPELVQLLGADAPEIFKKKAESLKSIFTQAAAADSGNVTVKVSTGLPHGDPLSAEKEAEPAGAEFFKPSKI